ncbi:TPA: hypothetical protein ACH3X2_007974 [Trebouxia sp. C0005]
MQGQQPADMMQHHLQLPTDPSKIGPFDPSSCRSLYIGNLHPYVAETQLQDLFSSMGSVSEVKVIKDKATGMSAGYGFVKFLDHASAEVAMHGLNGRLIFGQEVRVNWAFQKDQQEDTSQHCHIFVGDLSSELNDRALFEAFEHCGNCSDARVMWDHATGRSKGYGFVSFRTQEAAENAIAMMNGKLVGHRRTRCGWAHHKQNTNSLEPSSVDRADPQNANVYVGNVSPDVSDADIRQHFGHFGCITDVKIYRKGSYAFVNYTSHAEAVQAIVAMNGKVISNKALKCAWGRHQPHRNHGPALGMLQVQNHLGFLGAQNMLGSMSPMLGMPGGVQIPNQLQIPGPAQMPSHQHAQQLQQQALMHAQQTMPQGNPLGAQLSTAQATAQQQMLAAHRAQMDPSSLYFNMYAGMYGAP